MQKLHMSGHPLLLPVLVGAVGIFVGLGIRMVTAATKFQDPGCDPTGTGGIVCNTSGPLILNPTDSTATQVIGSPINIGALADPRVVTLFGNMQLGDSSSITSGSSHLGNSISVYGNDDNNVATSDYAIVGTSSSETFAGIFASNTASTGGQPGISATSTSGYGIEVNTSGKAAKFTGQVDVASTATTPGTFSVNGVLTVNGVELNPGSGNIGVKLANNIATNTTVDLDQELGWSTNNYQVNYIKAMYDDASQVSIEKTWIPVPSTNVSYTECNSNILTVTNPIANPVNFRIVIKYTKTPVSC